MALTTITINFDLHQLLGDDFDTRRTKAYVTTNVANGTLMDTSTGETRLGDQTVAIAADGTGSFDTWAIGSDGNPISWQTSLVVDYPRTGQRDRQRRTFGPYTLEVANDGDNITDLEEEQAVPAEYLTSVTTLLDGYADAAEASATAAAASAAAAVEYANGFDIGTVETLDPGADATAEIVDGLLNLGLVTGDQGPPGPGTGAGSWAAATAYTAAQVVQAGTGEMVQRIANGTSGASYDATEAAKWTPVSVTPELVKPTAGVGTSASPWTHADGLGGIATALTASRTSGRTLYVKRGHYAITTGNTALLTDDRIYFEPGVVLVPSGLSANQAIFNAVGSSGTHKTGITIAGAFRIDFTAMGATSIRGLNLEWVDNSQFPVQIVAIAGKGNVIRAVNCDALRLPPYVAHTDTSGAGSCVYLEAVTNTSGLESVYAEGVDEGVDLSNCAYVRGGHIMVVDSSEPIDIGSSSYCYFDSATGLRCSQGVNFKIDPGVNTTGVVGNRVERVVMIDMAASVAAVRWSMAGTSTGGLEPNDDNTVGTVYSRTSQSNSWAVSMAGRDSSNPLKRARVDHYNHVGPSEVIVFGLPTEDCHVGDANSYGETTGNAAAVFLATSGSATFNHVRPTIRGRVKAVNRTGSGNAAVQIMKTDGQGETVFDGHVLGSGAEGIITYQSKSLRLAGVVRECANSGVKIRVVDDANYRGQVDISWSGRMKNIAKSNPGVDSGVYPIAESGTPTIQGIAIEKGSMFLDDQGSSTTSVMNFGTADMVYIDVARISNNITAPLIGTLPITRKIRIGGRPTAGNTDEMVALAASFQTDGPLTGPRILKTTVGIDAKTTGTTTLYTVPTGHTAVIVGAIVRVTGASSLTVPPTLGIGVAAGEDDIFASTALTGLTVVTKVWRFDAGAGLLNKVASGGVIKLGIDTGATATTMTIAVELIGYLVV